jgi:hypothetical protein
MIPEMQQYKVQYNAWLKLSLKPSQIPGGFFSTQLLVVEQVQKKKLSANILCP